VGLKKKKQHTAGLHLRVHFFAIKMLETQKNNKQK